MLATPSVLLLRQQYWESPSSRLSNRKEKMMHLAFTIHSITYWFVTGHSNLGIISLLSLEELGRLIDNHRLILLISILDMSLIRLVLEPINTFVFKSIITSHIAFRLRQEYPEPKNTSQYFSLPLVATSIQFNSDILVGNAGAPLHTILSDLTEDEGLDTIYSNDPGSTRTD
ncbi:hypothetical protein QCA50_014617 [Cerrena zonata]|uniref:Uncharacterized protein n=1 Tax=Cerrena zonata TaxID=2478898 RepID=A0AAW0FSX8_9APHY